MERITAGGARRIALAAQGFADRRPAGRVDIRLIRRVIDRTSVLQIDSVNVLSRSHYLPIFSRLGPYDRGVLDAAFSERRELFEYWAHEASYVDIRLFPALRWRMQDAHDQAWGNMVRLQRERPGFVENVLAQVCEEGPLTGAVLRPNGPRRPGSMWNWHEGKVALEWLFFTGVLSAVRRTQAFERVYDLTERVIPSPILSSPAMPEGEAMRALIRTAAHAHGVATERDLRDYFRLPPGPSKQAVAELVESGELVPVSVDAWKEVGYLDPRAPTPRRLSARALLSPFDSLIWTRPRAERIFGFTYQLEIYTPAARRQHGYYVLPFLLGDRLVARVDLKADRQAGLLRVLSAHGEPDIDVAQAAPQLAAELVSMAAWLSLDGVVVGERGDLAGALRTAIASRSS
ncbi:MAG: winged helix DNA-binding domain-containing protein [Actinomycetota bacterium]|nr:winged helix DNA-binding domain-containing protein [Actinomycetota bacterium]